MNNTTRLSAAVMADLLLPRCSNAPDEQPTRVNTTVENVKKDIPKLPNNTASRSGMLSILRYSPNFMHCAARSNRSSPAAKNVSPPSA